VETEKKKILKKEEKFTGAVSKVKRNKSRRGKIPQEGERR